MESSLICDEVVYSTVGISSCISLFPIQGYKATQLDEGKTHYLFEALIREKPPMFCPDLNGYCRSLQLKLFLHVHSGTAAAQALKMRQVKAARRYAAMYGKPIPCVAATGIFIFQTAFLKGYPFDWCFVIAETGTCDWDVYMVMMLGGGSGGLSHALKLGRQFWWRTLMRTTFMRTVNQNIRNQRGKVNDSENRRETLKRIRMT